MEIQDLNSCIQNRSAISSTVRKFFMLISCSDNMVPMAAAVVSKGTGPPEGRLEDGDGDEFAGFGVHLRAERTRGRLAAQTPDLQRDSALRVLPLSGFPSLPIGVFWRRRLAEIARVFVDELAARAKRIFGKPEEDRV